MDYAPILIRQIRHLTDARYFAAMGVDWMSMELTSDQGTFAFWHAIRDWVAGVKLLAEIDSPDEDMIARVLIDAKPDGVLVREFSSPDFFHEKIHFKQPFQQPTIPIQSGDNVLLHLSQLDEWRKLHPGTPEENIFLESDWTPNEIQKILDNGYKGGFCFVALHDELEKGLKDFSEMDEMMEILRG